jgi:hypothetical protein
MITKLTAILSLVPNAEVTVRGDNVEWIVPATAPITNAEIEAEFDRLTALEPVKIIQAKRQAAYIAESDPLFFKSQRNEIPASEWLAKVEEIKNRYPNP